MNVYFFRYWLPRLYKLNNTVKQLTTLILLQYIWIKAQSTKRMWWKYSITNI